MDICNCDTIIFDLDGTLLKTIYDLTDSVNYVMRKYKYKERTAVEVQSFLGNGAKKLIERCIPDGQNSVNYESCCNDYINHYSSNLHEKTKPYDGVIVLLKKLKENGYKIGVVSNKMDSVAKKLVKNHFNEYIQVCQGQSDEVDKKPDPKGVYIVAKKLDTALSKCIYVGDSEVDIQTAKRANIFSISVSWGYRSKEVLQNAGAEIVIDFPEQLMDKLKYTV